MKQSTTSYWMIYGVEPDTKVKVKTYARKRKLTIPKALAELVEKGTK